MTGFGKSTATANNKTITVEIKSLNSKQLDLNTRISSMYRDLELELRNIIASKIERGKADLSINVEYTSGAGNSKLNFDVMKSYKEQIEQLDKELNLPEPSDWQSLLLHLPEAVSSDATQDVTEEEKDAVKRAVEEATDALMKYRRAEGEKLEVFFLERIEKIAEFLKQTEPLEQERVEKVKAKIEEGLKKLPAADFDQGRLEQEMIYYIEKLDVSEEKQRLTQHLNYFIETFRQPKPGQGKKLGFITQEMGREINTFGSKSNHAGLQRLVVMMKDELEQIKEQVLNVM